MQDLQHFDLVNVCNDAIWSIRKNNYLIYPYLLDFEVTLLEKVTLLTSFHHSF